MDDDDENVIDFNAQRAAAGLRGMPEADPKKAVRAYKLSQATGLPAGMVLDDMEATENDYRAALGTRMANNNEALARFLNSYPLAPVISKNDLGNLDQTSEKLTQWHNDQGKATWGEKARGLALMMNRGIESGTGIIASGIGYMTGATGFQGADERMLKSTEEGLKKQMGEEEYKRVRGSVEGTLAGDVAQGAGGLVPMLAAGFFGGTLPAALTMGLMNAEELRRRAEEKGGDQLAAFTAGGVIGTAFGFVPAHLLTKSVQAKAPGFISWTSAKLTQSGVFGAAMALTGEAQHDFNEWAARLIFDPNAMYHPDSRRFLTGFILGGMLGAGFQKVKPYVDADIPIPAGIDPIIDQTKGMEAKHDLEKLKELEKEVGKDETRELDPDFYKEKFLAQHGDHTLRIDIEAIRNLYGDKIPAPDDGILGHVLPDLDVAIRVARETGGYVELRLNDWLAKVDPEVANALHDDLVLREGGVSVNGDKANKEYQQKIEEVVEKAAEEQKKAEEVLSDATEDAVRPGQQEARVRAAPRARAEPQADITAPRDEISLAERPASPKEIKVQKIKDYTDPKTGETAAFFNLIDENGLNSGFASIAYRDGVIYIEGIGASTRFGKTAEERAGVFGPTIVRSILEQIKKEFPEATKIGGDRVTGARKKAGTTGEVEVALELNAENLAKIIKDAPETPPKGWEAAGEKTHPRDMLPTGEDIFHYEIRDGTWIALRPRNVYSAKEREMVNYIDEAIEKFIGRDKEGKKRIEVQDTFGIAVEKHGVITGFYKYDPRSTAIPLILYSLRAGDPYGTLRHEVIHHLYRKGFFTDTEWKIMEDAAEANGWIKKHNIDERYAGYDYKIQLEEAIADEFRIWGRDRYANHPAVKPFEKLRALLAQIRAKLIELTGLEKVTADDLFARIESGEIKLREPTEPPSDFMRRVNAVRDEAGLREETLFSKDGSPFEPKALGITVKESSKILKHWNRQVKADEKANQEAEMKKVMRNRSPQWKAWRSEMREEVDAEVRNRPDHLVDRFMRDSKFKFDADMLSEAQKKILPKDIYAKDTGIDPDYVASTFGYHSGEAMINRYAQLLDKRQNTDPKTFLKNEVDKITDQRMEKKYGTPEKEAMQEAYDHALGENTLDLIHEQTISLGSTKPDVAIQITKKQVKDYVMDMFDRLPMSMAKASDFLAQAKRAEQRIRMALMDDKFSEAYREQQAKEYAVISAKYANDLKKVENKVDRIARRFAKREVENADPEIVAFIQQILDRFEYKLRREAYDYEDRIAMFQESGAPKYRDLRELVQKKWPDEKDPPISDLLYDPNFKGPIENLTTEQFQELAGSLSALQKKAVDAYTVEVKGEKVKLYDVVSNMENVFIERFPKGKEVRIDVELSHLSKFTKWYWANHIVWETIFNRLDLNNFDGLFNQALGLPLIRGANAAARLALDAGERFKAMPIAREMNRRVDNPWFRRPQRVDENNKIEYGDLMEMDRGNVLAVLQNMGNPQNWYGLLDGYGIPRDRSGDVMDWVWKHVTKEDVQRAKEMGNTFDWAFDKAAATVAADTGYPPPKVKTWVIKTPWGDVDGWYHKIAYDKEMAQSIKSLVDPSMLIERQFNRPSPSASYAKTRTGATGPYILNLDMAPHWVNEMLYDSALRLPLKEASKIMGHANFKLAMTKHMGKHYTDLIDPFLKDVAGVMDYDSNGQHIGVKTWRFIRANIISHYVGANPGTFVKHNASALINSMTENGAAAYWKKAAQQLFTNPPAGDSWSQFAIQMSDQLAPRHVNWVDTLTGAHAQVYGNVRLGVSAKDWAASFKDRPWGEGINFAGKQLGGVFLAYRQGLMWVEAWPLATFDLLTAKTTWLTAYGQEMARSGNNIDRAIDFADRAVRRSHGATTVTNRPGFMRGGEFARSMTAFYTTFNHFLQRQYEFAWAIKELSSGGKYYVRPDKILEWKGDGMGAAFHLGARALPVFAAQLVSYLFWPAFVEMAAGGFEKDKNEGWFTNYLKHVARMGFGGGVVTRDIASALVHGADPTVGIGGEIYKTGHRVIKKTIEGKFNTREQQQAYIRDVYSFFNMLNGMLPANAVMRTGMFTWNWANNRERVQGPGDVWWGVTKGTTQPHRRH